MAVVGDVLTQPEAGWKRCDDNSLEFEYSADWSVISDVPSYGGQTHSTTTLGSTVKFNFYGDAIRILGATYTNFSDSVTISIDGVEESFSANGSLKKQVVLYEKKGLARTQHWVTITNNSKGSNKNYHFDCVDVNDFGYLLPYNDTPYHNKILLLSENGNSKTLASLGLDENQNAIPQMSSDNEVFGIASASDFEDARFHPWRAFDNSTGGNPWRTSSPIRAGWLKYQFNEATVINKYVIYPRPIEITSSPKAWSFEGSDDDVNWNILDSQSNISDWSPNVGKTFEFSNTRKYKLYRMNIIDNNGLGYLAIAELEMYSGRTNIVEFIPSKSEQSFINHGMSLDDLASIDMSTEFTEKHYIQDTSTPLGEGKVFEQVLDGNKMLKKIKVT